jgi:hypothetical protein
MKFMTKKDKIIEEQKARIKELEDSQSAFMARFNRPIIIEQQREIIKVCCSQLLENGMPVDYAKKEIAHKMANELQRFIEYEIEDGISKDGAYKNSRPYPLITGYLNVAIQ